MFSERDVTCCNVNNNMHMYFWFAAVEDGVRFVEIMGGKAHGYKCDLANREDVYRVASLTQNEVGQVSMMRVLIAYYTLSFIALIKYVYTLIVFFYVKSTT